MSSASSGGSDREPAAASGLAHEPPSVQDAIEGRPSAIEPQIRLERRVSPFFGFIFYGFLFGAAWVWMVSTGQSVSDAWTPKNLPLESAVGVGTGLLFVLATPISIRCMPALRELEREFGWILGEQRAWECLYLAILSAAAEEFFFRGAAQGALGPVWAVVLFAALHWPINAQFRAWPILAAIAGTVLALQREVLGSLIAPVATHAVINAINHMRVTRKYRTWVE